MRFVFCCLVVVLRCGLSAAVVCCPLRGVWRLLCNSSLVVAVCCSLCAGCRLLLHAACYLLVVAYVFVVCCCLVTCGSRCLLSVV